MPRRDRPPQQKGGLIRMGIRAASAGIGLASESIKARKEGKVPAKAQESDQGPMSRTASEGGDEVQRNGVVEQEAAPPAASSKQAEATGNTDPYEEPPPSYSDVAESSTGSRQNPDRARSYDDEKMASSHQPNDDANEKAEDNLEEEWDLDDAQDEMIPNSTSAEQSGESSSLEDAFLLDHPPPKYTAENPPSRLPLPVVLPQRRPKTRSRGFIRAYAPVLENCGIDQATWLAFLDKFQKSSAADPWINAVNLAAIGISFAVPTGVGFAVGYAIRQAASATMEMQARYRTNTFLQKINDNFFRPRGLYCLVMTWNPDSAQHVEQVNLTATIASRSNRSSGVTAIPKKFSTSDGNTYGAAAFPEVAPLVFPALDKLATEISGEGAKKKGKMANGMKFVGEYWDRRATAEYAGINPHSALSAGQNPSFSSRYADPNSSAASGSLISFVSGGKLVPEPHSRGLLGGVVSVVGQAVRGEKQGAAWERYRGSQQEAWDQQRGRGGLYSRYYRGRGRRGIGGTGVVGPIGAARKVLKKNVLYLMVVNMPSKEELAAATAEPGQR